MPDHVTVRQNVDPDTLDDQRRDTINLDAGVACEINIVLAGKLVIQVMIDDDRQYTVFDAEHDGVDGAL